MNENSTDMNFINLFVYCYKNRLVFLIFFILAFFLWIFLSILQEKESVRSFEVIDNALIENLVSDRTSKYLDQIDISIKKDLSQMFKNKFKENENFNNYINDKNLSSFSVENQSLIKDIKVSIDDKNKFSIKYNGSLNNIIKDIEYEYSIFLQKNIIEDIFILIDKNIEDIKIFKSDIIEINKRKILLDYERLLLEWKKFGLKVELDLASNIFNLSNNFKIADQLGYEDPVLNTIINEQNIAQISIDNSFLNLGDGNPKYLLGKKIISNELIKFKKIYTNLQYLKSLSDEKLIDEFQNIEIYADLLDYMSQSRFNDNDFSQIIQIVSKFNIYKFDFNEKLVPGVEELETQLLETQRAKNELFKLMNNGNFFIVDFINNKTETLSMNSKQTLLIYLFIALMLGIIFLGFRKVIEISNMEKIS